MEILAYIPDYAPELNGINCRCCIARGFSGRIIPVEAITINPRVKTTLQAMIKEAYEAKSIPFIEWDEAVKDGLVKFSGQDVKVDTDLKDKDVVVVGGGASVNEFDLSLLDDYNVIAVNRAYEIVQPDILCSMDKRFFDWAFVGRFGETIKKRYQSLDCEMLLFSSSPAADKRVKSIPRAERNKPTHNINEGVFIGQQNGRNSGIAAVHLACLLGAKRVYMLGFDCDVTQDKTHYHDGYPEVQGKGVYNKFLAAWNACADDLKEMAEIINLNPDSKIRCFDFGELPRAKRTRKQKSEAA